MHSKAMKLNWLIILTCAFTLMLWSSSSEALSVSKKTLSKLDNTSFIAALIRFKSGKQEKDYATYSLFYDECQRRNIDYDEEMAILDPNMLRKLSTDQLNKILDEYHSKNRVAGRNAEILQSECKQRNIDFNARRKRGADFYDNLRIMPTHVFAEELYLFKTNPGASRWQQDEIVRECNRRGIDFLTGGSSVARGQHANIDSVDTTIKRNCQKEWGDNYRMVAYCIKQQKKAYSRLDYPCPSRVPSYVCEKIKTTCGKEWEENYRMVLYCTRKQSEAYLKLYGN